MRPAASQLTADGATTVLYDATGNRTTVATTGATVNYTTSTGNRARNCSRLGQTFGYCVLAKIHNRFAFNQFIG